MSRGDEGGLFSPLTRVGEGGKTLPTERQMNKHPPGDRAGDGLAGLEAEDGESCLRDALIISTLEAASLEEMSAYLLDHHRVSLPTVFSPPLHTAISALPPHEKEIRLVQLKYRQKFEELPGKYCFRVNWEAPQCEFAKLKREYANTRFVVDVKLTNAYPKISPRLTVAAIPKIPCLEEVSRMAWRESCTRPKTARDAFQWLRRNIVGLIQIANEVWRIKKRRKAQSNFRQKAQPPSPAPKQVLDRKKTHPNPRKARKKAVENPMSERLAEKYTPSWDICTAFKRSGKCKNRKCKWRHAMPNK